MEKVIINLKTNKLKILNNCIVSLEVENFEHLRSNTRVHFFVQKVWCWVDGWVGSWMDGWMVESV